jgi:hypothetical protein
MGHDNKGRHHVRRAVLRKLLKGFLLSRGSTSPRSTVLLLRRVIASCLIPIVACDLSRCYIVKKFLKNFTSLIISTIFLAMRLFKAPFSVKVLLKLFVFDL